MKGSKIFTFVLALLVGVALVFAVSKLSGNGSDVTVKAQAGDDKQKTRALLLVPKATGGMESGDAVIELTPQITDENKLIVTFRMNTHSVDFSKFDMKEITTLEYHGNVVKPLKASRIGGHHFTGKIIFDVGENIDSFIIRIKGIPKVDDRVYEWSV